MQNLQISVQLRALRYVPILRPTKVKASAVFAQLLRDAADHLDHAFGDRSEFDFLRRQVEPFQIEAQPDSLGLDILDCLCCAGGLNR